MMKCSLCGSKAKRNCRVRNFQEICPRCCATTRSQECAGCEYFEVSQHFQREKFIKSGKRDFILEIKEDLESVINNALELIEKDRYAQAEALLQKAEAIDPDYYLLAFARGTVHAKKNEFDQAISCFDRAIKKFPFFVEAFFNLGMAYKGKLDLPNSIRSFREVTRVGDVDDENVRWARSFLHDLESGIRKTDCIDLDAYLAANDAFDKGVDHMTNQEWENAIAAFEICARISPKSPKPYGNIGLCKAKLGMKAEAMAAFDKALELDPKYEPVIVNRAALKNDFSVPDGPIPMIEYAKDYQAKGKSLVRETIELLNRE